MNELQSLSRYFSLHHPQPLGVRRHYAVLCPLVETAGGLQVLFEIRAAGVRQGGEVCFPGGGMEAGETPSACALRETEEELSIPRSEIHLLGSADYIVMGEMLLEPFVGIISPAGLAALSPSPDEVAETFTVPLSFFRNTPPRVYSRVMRSEAPDDFPFEELGISRNYPWRGSKVEIPVWVYEGRVIWGLTARMLRGILAIIDGEVSDSIS